MFQRDELNFFYSIDTEWEGIPSLNPARSREDNRNIIEREFTRTADGINSSFALCVAFAPPLLRAIGFLTVKAHSSAYVTIKLLSVGIACLMVGSVLRWTRKQTELPGAEAVWNNPGFQLLRFWIYRQAIKVEWMAVGVAAFIAFVAYMRDAATPSEILMCLFDGVIAKYWWRCRTMSFLRNATVNLTKQNN